MTSRPHRARVSGYGVVPIHRVGAPPRSGQRLHRLAQHVSEDGGHHPCLSGFKHLPDRIRVPIDYTTATTTPSDVDWRHRGRHRANSAQIARQSGTEPAHMLDENSHDWRHDGSSAARTGLRTRSYPDCVIAQVERVHDSERQAEECSCGNEGRSRSRRLAGLRCRRVALSIAGTDCLARSGCFRGRTARKKRSAQGRRSDNGPALRCRVAARRTRPARRHTFRHRELHPLR